jgi:hypothetical protein
MSFGDIISGLFAVSILFILITILGLSVRAFVWAWGFLW